MERSGAFPTTKWNLVLSAGKSADPQSAEALCALCEAYWYPLYVFIRRTGRSREDAQDLTQAFFARVLEKRYLDHPSPEKGRFRSFLLSSLKFFLSDEADRNKAAKRGGGIVPIPLDMERGEERYLREPADPETPESIFERQWALALLQRVLESLQKELQSEGKAEQFESLKAFLVSDATSYSQTASRQGMTEGTLKVRVHRLRKRYRDLFRAEIRSTVAAEEDVEAEIRFLGSVLRGGGAKT